MDRPHNILDSILKLVPGYAGYNAREERRQSDARIRDKIASLLQQCETALTAKLSAELRAGSRTAEQVEHCRKRINTLLSQVKFAPYGASAFMEQQELKEEELQEIMNRDLALLVLISQLAERIQDLNMHDLDTVLNRVDSALEERNSYIREYK